MKTIMTFLLSLSLTLIEHDVAVATFTIYQEANTLRLDVSFDIRDLSAELDKKTMDITVKMVETYLNEHVEFSFDGQRRTINVKELKKKRGHLIAQSVFKTNDLEFTNIQLKNTCLMKVEEHSNILEVRLSGQERDFRMHKDRTFIEVQL